MIPYLKKIKEPYSFTNLFPGPLDNHTQRVACSLVMEVRMLPIWRKTGAIEARKTYDDTLRVILCLFVS